MDIPDKYYGIYISSKEAKEEFWSITCPCGITVSYPINGLPEVTTKHPCGKEGHWTVLVDAGAQK